MNSTICILLRFTSLSLLVSAITVNAQERQPPSDLELRAMYCLSAGQAGFADMARLRVAPGHLYRTDAERIAQEEFDKIFAEFEVDLDRLRLYVHPKLSYLQLEPLLAAKLRAERDISEVGTQNKTCSSNCGNGKDPVNREQLDRYFACMSSCMASSAASKRLRACRPVDWLPF